MGTHSMLVNSTGALMETVDQVAGRIGVPVRTLRHWCSTGRVPEAVKVGRCWLIPDDAEISRPRMGRPRN